MIADLESMGRPDSEKKSTVSPQRIAELSADYLVASSPRIAPPLSLRESVLQRISSEPARVRTDADGHVVEINPAFSGLCGFSFSEIQGRKPGSLLQGPDTEPECVETIRSAVRDGKNCETEMWNYHKDGSRYRVHIRIDALRDADGNLTGFQATETRL